MYGYARAAAADPGAAVGAAVAGAAVVGAIAAGAAEHRCSRRCLWWRGDLSRGARALRSLLRLRPARCCHRPAWLLEPPSSEPPSLAFGPVHTASSRVSRLERSVLLQLLGSEAAVGRGGAGQAPAVPRAASVHQQVQRRASSVCHEAHARQACDARCSALGEWPAGPTRVTYVTCSIERISQVPLDHAQVQAFASPPASW